MYSVTWNDRAMVEVFGYEFPQLKMDDDGTIYHKYTRQGDSGYELRDAAIFRDVLEFIRNFIECGDDPWFLLDIELPALCHIVRETYKREGIPCGVTKARNMSRLLNRIFWYFKTRSVM